MKRTPVFVAVLCVLVCSVYAAPSLTEARKKLLERLAGNVRSRQTNMKDATIQELDDIAKVQLFEFITRGMKQIGRRTMHLLSGNSPPESKTKVNTAASAQNRMIACQDFQKGIGDDVEAQNRIIACQDFQQGIGDDVEAQNRMIACQDFQQGIGDDVEAQNRMIACQDFSEGVGDDEVAKAQVFDSVKRRIKWIRNKLKSLLHGGSKTPEPETEPEQSDTTEAPALKQSYENEAEIEILAKLLADLE